MMNVNASGFLRSDHALRQRLFRCPFSEARCFTGRVLRHLHTAMNNHGSHRGWKAKNNDSDSLSKSHPRMTFGDWLKDGERSYDITRWFNAGAAGVLFLESIDVGFRIQGIILEEGYSNHLCLLGCLTKLVKSSVTLIKSCGSTDLRAQKCEVPRS